MKLGALTKEPVTEAGVYIEVPDDVPLDSEWFAANVMFYDIGYSLLGSSFSRTLTPLQLGADERDGEIAELKAKLENSDKQRDHWRKESRTNQEYANRQHTEKLDAECDRDRLAIEITRLRARLAALESPPKVEGVERPDDAFKLCWISDSATARISIYALSLERETKRLQARVAELEETWACPPPADPDAEPVPYLGVVCERDEIPVRWATIDDVIYVADNSQSSLIATGEYWDKDEPARLAMHGKLALARAAKAKGECK